MTPSQMRRAKRRADRLVGRSIVQVDLRPFPTDVAGEPGDVTCNPAFVFDDGTRIVFRVAETETGEYGVEPIILPQDRRRRRKP